MMITKMGIYCPFAYYTNTWERVAVKASFAILKAKCCIICISPLLMLE